MKTLFGIIVTVFFALVQCEHASAVERLKELTAIGDLWNEPRSEPCEAILRESYFKAATAAADVRFEDVLRVFGELGNLSYTSSDDSYCELVLRRDVTFKEHMPAHELVIAMTKGQDGGAACLEVLLRVAVNKRLTAVVSDQLYPMGSLVSEVLTLDHLKTKAKTAGLVMRIDIAFGEIKEPDSVQKGHGFTVRMQLADKVPGDSLTGTANATYRALSGLDPVINFATDATAKPIGALFRPTVLLPKRALTKPGATPAIWVSVESD